MPQEERYRISRRQYITGAPYCRRCADKIKVEISRHHKHNRKQIAESLGIPHTNCDKAGTCEILKAHHNVLSNDPDRLTTEFLIGMICGEDGVRKYKQNQKKL